MLTAIIIIVMLVIGFGLVALYREVGLGKEDDAVLAEAPGPASNSPWPFRNITAGSHFAVPSEDAYTGFLALCTDDQDALGELYSAAVVAEEWGYPFLVAITKSLQPSGWADRLDSLPGNLGQYEMRADELRALGAVRLPVIAFLNEGRLLDAIAAGDSPSSIATTFQHCRFGLAR